MITNLEKKNHRRLKRKRSIRKKVFGTGERPRLTVYRSLRHTYAQVVDDTDGRTLVAASTMDKELRAEAKKLKKGEAAGKVGELLAERCIRSNISKLVLDRNGNAYGGRVARLAAAAREKGLSF